MENLKYFESMQYHGMYIYATYEQNETVKKNILSPKKDEYETETHYFKPIYDSNQQKFINPNAICIDTSDISIIDIDDIYLCGSMLDELLNKCKFTIKTPNGYQFYFYKCNELYERNFKGGKNLGVDINLDHSFYCPEYINVENGEKYNYELISKNPELVDMDNSIIYWCNKKIYEKTKQMTQKKELKDNDIAPIINDKIKINKLSCTTMDIIYDILQYTDVYKDTRQLLKLAFFARNLNNSEENLNKFYEYSKKERPTLTLEKARKYFYGNNTYDMNFSERPLLYECLSICRENLAIHKHSTLISSLVENKYNNKLHKIEKQFLYDGSPEMTDLFKNWIDNYKILAIKSAYGTGKTYAMMQIAKNHGFKRILFLTYRRSLAYSTSNDLKKNGFVSYLDATGTDGGKLNIKNEDRIIMQIDSIYKLVNDEINFFSDKSKIPTFDLIVLDESEGLLKHLSYDKIDSVKISNILLSMMYKANKILALDGDMGQRTYDFINDYKHMSGDRYMLYENIYKTQKKKYIFTNDLENYDKNIDEDLKAGKNIVIVSMSATRAEKYYNKYHETYKTMIHTAENKNINTLKNINDEWKVQLLIYSPTVEAGCDFNEKHFHKCYGYLSSKSTTYRAFSQMLNRVRKFEENDIYIYSNKFRLDRVSSAVPYTFEEIKTKKFLAFDSSLLNNIFIHNEVEYMNSADNLFIASLINLIKSKGHDYEIYDKAFIKGEKKYVDEKDETLTKDQKKKNIIEAPNIDNVQYRALLLKRNKDEPITPSENNSIKKYIYSKCFNFPIEKIDKKFMDDTFDKIGVIKNYRNLKRGYYNNSRSTLNEIETIKIKLILEILKDIGFDINNFEPSGELHCTFTKSLKDKKADELTKISNEQNKILRDILACTKAYEIKKNENDDTPNKYNIRNFFLANGERLQKQNETSLLNSVINNYGLHISKFRVTQKVNKKPVNISFYKIDLQPFIKLYEETQ